MSPPPSNCCPLQRWQLLCLAPGLLCHPRTLILHFFMQKPSKRKVVSADIWLLPRMLLQHAKSPCLKELCVCMSEIQWISFSFTSVTAGSECVPASARACVLSHANMIYLNRKCFSQSQVLGCSDPVTPS